MKTQRVRLVMVVAGWAVGAALVWWAGWGQSAPLDPKDLAVPPEVMSKARLLVQRLGSDSYREREEAQAELARMGRLARPALLEAIDQHPNAEVRFRAQLLLPQASAEDLKARLDAFLADSEARYEHALPGLARFRKLVGTDVKARNLFAEFVKSPHNLELLAAVEQGEGAAGRAIADRRYLLFAQLQGQRILPNGAIVHEPRPIAFADIACLLFAEAVVPARFIPSTPVFNHVSGTLFLQQPASVSVLHNSSAPHAEAYRRLVGIWLASRDDPNDWNNLVHLLSPGGSCMGSRKRYLYSGVLPLVPIPPAGPKPRPWSASSAAMARPKYRCYCPCCRTIPPSPRSGSATRTSLISHLFNTICVCVISPWLPCFT